MLAAGGTCRRSKGTSRRAQACAKGPCSPWSAEVAPGWYSCAWALESAAGKRPVGRTLGASTAVVEGITQHVAGRGQIST